jgi:transcriptional regulator with XRE-family HTH domain
MRHRLNAEKLRREIGRRGLDGAQFARACGVSAGTVSNALQGRPVNPSTLRKFSSALAKLIVVDDIGLLDQETA